MQHARINVCLDSVAAAEAGKLYRIPIAVTGTWTKDGSTFSITDLDLSQMVSNFSARKNGSVVADYDHASESPKVAAGKPIPASGWVMALSKVGGTLFADVDWTQAARDLIQSKEYRFVSPAIDWNGENKETGESLGTVLSSLALTNHPFLEELPALCLSEKAIEGQDGKLVIHVAMPAKIALADVDQGLYGKIDAVSSAIRKQYNPWPGTMGIEGPWVKDVYDAYAIVECGGKLWKVGYTMDADSDDVVKLDAPVEVHITYVEEKTTMSTKKTLSDKEQKELDDQVEMAAKKKLAEDEEEKKKKDEEDEEELSKKKMSAIKADDSIPELSMRRMNSADGSDKDGHAIMAADGKLMGYMAHKKLMKYAKLNMPEDTTAMSDNEKNTLLLSELRTATGRPTMTLSDATKHIEFSIAHGTEVAEATRKNMARTLLLSEGFGSDNAINKRAVRGLFADGKITARDQVDFEDAAEDVEKLVLSGKFLPMQKRSLVMLALSDRKAFDELAEKQQQVIQLSEKGIAGDGQVRGDGDVDVEVVAATRRLMSEKNMTYGDAHKQVLSADPSLKSRYDKAHRKQVQ